MTSIRKNKIWKELYLKTQDFYPLLLQEANCEDTFQDIIIEHLSTGIDPFVLLEHKYNILTNSQKSKEEIDRAVDLLLKEFKEKSKKENNIIEDDVPDIEDNIVNIEDIKEDKNIIVNDVIYIKKNKKEKSNGKIS